MKRVWYPADTIAGSGRFYAEMVSDERAEEIGAVMHWKPGKQGEYRFATPCKTCGDLAWGFARMYPDLDARNYNFKVGPYCPACMKRHYPSTRVFIVDGFKGPSTRKS